MYDGDWVKAALLIAFIAVVCTWMLFVVYSAVTCMWGGGVWITNSLPMGCYDVDIFTTQ